MHKEEKSYRNNDEALQKYQFSTPTNKDLTILRYTRMRPTRLPSKDNERGVINGTNAIISTRYS